MPRRLLAVLTALAAPLLFAAPAAAAALPVPSTPQLIERANLGKAEELRMLAYAVARPRLLPQRFRSDTPWDGTFVLRRLHREAPRLMESLAEPRINTEPSFQCSVFSVGPNPQVLETEHFYIEYAADQTFQGGLTIQDYADSLEGAWATEIDEFGYAAPPPAPTSPNGKYNVRIGPLGAGLYGFVSNQGTYAGEVGDNPNTPWTEDDADASCMGLNSDYVTGFDQLTVGTAQGRLDATTAHEFLHSIQYGYGALDGGDHEPDLNFTEGHATWMEDEVYDDANDSYNYLYPEFRDSMGEHDQGSEYSYFLIWRGLTERFGSGSPGVAEDFVQRFYEIISREEYGPMDAIANAYSPTGVSLTAGFHDFARAARFLKQCGGGYVLPYCFEEADGYAEVAGERPAPDGEIDAMGGTYGTDAEPAEVEDNQTLNWVDLPDGDAPLEVVLDHRGDDGALRVSVICDTGSEIRVSAAVDAEPDTDGVTQFLPEGCATRPTAVITNHTRSGGPNPGESTTTPYTLRVRPGPAAQAPPTAPPQTQPVPSSPVTPFVAPPVACTAGSRLRSVSARPRGRGLRLAFAPRGGAKVDVDVFQSSSGDRIVGDRVVARFRGRARSFTWNGRANRKPRRVRDGYLFVRFRSGEDVRRIAVRRVGGRFVARPSFSRADACATLASYKLLRPVFGGTGNRAATVTYRLTAPAAVTLEVLERGVVVRRLRGGTRQPGTHRFRVGAKRFIPGDVTFRLRVVRDGRTQVARLVARRL